MPEKCVRSSSFWVASAITTALCLAGLEGARAATLPQWPVSSVDGSAGASTSTPVAAIDAPSFLLAAATFKALVPPSSERPPVQLARLRHYESEAQRNTDCENGVLHGAPCRVQWGRVLAESLLFLAAQHGGNIALDEDTRTNLTHGSYWGDYIYCVDHYRYSRWKDDDPVSVDYVGHPMMGGLTNYIYEQSDPKQRALTFENTQRYWMGRLRATAYSAAYSAQWKVGPASEASVGNTGIGYYIRDRDGLRTNETGMQDFFVTPIGGLAWNVGEDMVDRYIISHIRRAHRNRLLLFAASFATPLRSTANVARLRAPYYRDPDFRSVELEAR